MITGICGRLRSGTSLTRVKKPLCFSGFRLQYRIAKRRISQNIGPMLPVPFIVVDEENKRCFRKRYVGDHNSRLK